jgi:hypothetical protein
MSYKHENIVLSVYNDQQAHNYFREYIRERTNIGDSIKRPNYKVLAKCCRYADQSAAAQYSRRTSSEAREAWMELLFEFGYIDDVSLLPKTEFDEVSPQPKTEDTPMNPETTITVETKHFVGGKEVSGLSNDDLITAVKKLENEINDLKNVATKSKFIEQKITELEETLKVVVEHLDARAA